jgi:hypothetical protein
LGTLAVVLLTAGVNAQGKPDFTGKWTREAPAGGAAAGGGGGGGGRGGGGGGGGRGFGGGGFQCGMTCDIKVTGNDMTVTRTQGEQTVTSKFNLAGEATNAGGRDGSTQIKTTGKWDGNKVVLSTTRDVQGQSVTSTQTLSIEGGKLTVVSNSGMEGAMPQTSTYTKG